MNRRFGWKGYIRDRRDDAFKMASPSMSSIPETRSLFPNCTRIENQLWTSSCIGHGGQYISEARDRRIGQEFVELSPYFAYHIARAESGCEDVDGGAYVRDLLTGLKKYGICQLELMPSDPDRINERPSDLAFEDAALRKITSFHRCDTLAAALGAIAAGLPIVYGFACYESYDSPEVQRTGIIPLPHGGESLRGGHCVAGYAYDRREQWISGPNSYGEDWGDRGRYKIPFKFFEEELANEVFAVVV